jgi:hypothetical protein
VLPATAKPRAADTDEVRLSARRQLATKDMVIVCHPGILSSKHLCPQHFPVPTTRFKNEPLDALLTKQILRTPAHDGHDSEMMADTIPA